MAKMEEHHIEAKVKELVVDFKLDEALDVLIAQAQTQNQRKENTLLILKGKLAMLEEQNLAGMLDPAELARQKATIAHQILDIADGSSLDHEAPAPPQGPPEVLIQKTVKAPATSSLLVKMMLAGLGLLLVFFLVFRLSATKSNNQEEGQTTQQEKPQDAEPTKPANDHSTRVQPQAPKSEKAIKVIDFPNLKKPFNFLDFGLEFASADAEWVSDNEIRLKIRYLFICKSNFGICYRAAIRVYADGQLINPSEQSNTEGWAEQNASSSDDVVFVLPAAAKEYMIEFSRDHSTWKRAFKITK